MIHRLLPLYPILAATLLLVPACGRLFTTPGTPPPPTHAFHESDLLTAEFPNGLRMVFALHDGELLGLQTVEMWGMALTSPDTVLRPILAEEWAQDRIIWNTMMFEGFRVEGNTLLIDLRLKGSRSTDDFREWFVFQADRRQALATPWPDEIEPVRLRYTELQQQLEALLREDETYGALAAEIDDKEAVRATVEHLSLEDRNLRDQVRRLRQQLQRREAALRPELQRDSETYQAIIAERDTLTEVVDRQAMAFGDIHRDYYRFAIPRQPSEVNDLAARREAAEREAPYAGIPGGRMTWIIEPAEMNIAGWDWQGWQHSFDFTLDDGRKVNVLRQLGTWELDGGMDGLTGVAMRYRGLGRIEQPFTVDPAGGGVREAWMTSDIIPGAAGRPPAVSPVVPDSEAVGDRGYALQHRIGAWIALPARGAGAPFFEFQYRPHAGLISFHRRQGNWRALSETYPGDRHLSQIDEQWFALTDRHRTEPQVYLVLIPRGEPLAAHEWRTRWREVDQHLRDMVSAELNLVQHDPLPGFGMLKDFSGHHVDQWPTVYQNMIKRLSEQWHEDGVRLIASHNPGFISGRFTGPDGPPRTYGGVCDIYDWLPTSDVREPWRAFVEKASGLDIDYYIWLGQTQVRHAPFAERVGLEREHWSLNAPGDEGGPGYGPFSMKGNIFHPRFADEFTRTLEQLREETGFQGFWVDSLHNLFMSQLNWAPALGTIAAGGTDPGPASGGASGAASGGTSGGASGGTSGGAGDSMQRAWWEWFAARTQEGIALMAESMAFPGLSCSIEIREWYEDYWALQYVWKWHRGTSQNDFTPQQHDRMAFQLMAAKGWAAPDLTQSNWYQDAHRDITTFSPTDIIPSFRRFAHEYMAALPMMKRSWVLPDGLGMLWLPIDKATEGVWFAFRDAPAPDGVRVTPILDKQAEAADRVRKHHTYRITGDDLIRSFSIRIGTLDDVRLMQ